MTYDATQITSMVAEYGPRTTVLVALDDGVYEFSYGCTPEGCQLADGSFAPWICSRHHIQIKADSKIFSPGNMRSAQEVRANSAAILAPSVHPAPLHGELQGRAGEAAL
jgi:hypothetical protein